MRPKAPTAGVRPLAPSSHDHAVPEARRGREPLPDEATVPMRRSDRPSMPSEDDWTSGSQEATRDVVSAAREGALSPKPAMVATSASTASTGTVVTDANGLREALQEALEPMQRALDDLTVKIARERVDRKEAVERLERTLARVATGNPPPVSAFAAAIAAPPAPIASPFASPSPPQVAAARHPVVAPTATAAPAGSVTASMAVPTQPFSVSPSASPPAVAPNAPAATTPATSQVSAPVGTAPTAAAASPASIVVTTASVAPVKYNLDPYSTDLSFELPKGLDGSRRKRILGWLVFVLFVGGAIAMIASMLYSRSRPPGAL